MNPLAPPSPPHERWWLLLTVMVGTMAAIMSSTVVNVAIPDLSQHFGLGQERAQWVTSGFMAASTASMLTTPWLLARLGYRRTYTLCVWALMLGGVVGGLAQDYTMVMAARVLEGLAAGVVQPIPAILIMRTFGANEQGRASGLFGMGVVLAPALGPSVGGLLVDLWGWRSIFYMVVPFGLLALWMTHRHLPRTGSLGPQTGEPVRFDAVGLVLVSLATVGLLNGLVGLQGGTQVEALGLLAASAGLLAAFALWQRRRRRQHDRLRPPLIHTELFQHRQFAMGSLVGFIYGAALFGSTYLLPVYLQAGLGLSPSYVGVLMLPAGLVLASVIALAGRLTDQHPPHRLVSLGLLVMGLAFAGMALLEPDTGLLWLVALTVLSRVGLGCILPALSVGSLRGLPHTLLAQASSTSTFVRMVGGACGVSLCGMVLEWRLAAHGSHLGWAGEQATQGRMAAFHEAFVMLATVCALATCAAWNLRPRRTLH